MQTACNDNSTPGCLARNVVFIFNSEAQRRSTFRPKDVTFVDSKKPGFGVCFALNIVLVWQTGSKETSVQWDRESHKRNAPNMRWTHHARGAVHRVTER